MWRRVVAVMVCCAAPRVASAQHDAGDAGMGDSAVRDGAVRDGGVRDGGGQGDAAVGDGGVSDGAVGDEAAAADDGPVTDDDERAAEAAVETPEGAPAEGTPTLAVEIAALTNRQCLRALVRAHVPYERVHARVPGVVTPIVVTGPIGGITWHAAGERAVHETMDCRLAVALVRYAGYLRGQHVREVRHLSLYRAPSPREVARHPVQTRHPGGMAIDIGAFVFDDGTSLVVEQEFRGRRGRPPCGPSARVPAVAASRRLRTLFCDAVRHGYFNVLLGPNYNYEHRNHFHFEVMRGVS